MGSKNAATSVYTALAASDFACINAQVYMNLP